MSLRQICTGLCLLHNLNVKYHILKQNTFGNLRQTLSIYGLMKKAENCFESTFKFENIKYEHRKRMLKYSPSIKLAWKHRILSLKGRYMPLKISQVKFSYGYTKKPFKFSRNFFSHGKTLLTAAVWIMMITLVTFRRIILWRLSASKEITYRGWSPLNNKQVYDVLRKLATK